MSPIVARAAIRAANAAQRRHFSMIGSLRNFARTFEAHPFERLPITAKPQSADWGRQIKRIGGQAVLFVPGIGLILGWPAITKAVAYGNIWG